MDVSQFLARALGIHLVIISATMLCMRERFLMSIEAIVDDAATRSLVAIFTLVLGILMIVAHSIWVDDIRLLISILCWAVFLKGLFLFLLPDLMITLTKKLYIKPFYYSAGVFALVLALILLSLGFSS